MRNLERELSTLIRKAVKELILSEKKSVKASADNLADYLGVPKYRYGEVEDKDLIGVVTGLAWTDVGGELLTIEAAMMPGKGRMTVTGNLRDVMKESISAAASYVRSRAVAFGIEPPLFDQRNIHVHVPEGATPKDGPSAGVAMVTAIVSVMTGIPVRRDLAMTGGVARCWHSNAYFSLFLCYFSSTHRTDLSRFRGTFHSFDPVGFAIFAITRFRLASRYVLRPVVEPAKPPAVVPSHPAPVVPSFNRT